MLILAARRPRSRLTGLALRGLLVFASLSISLGLVEIALRLLGAAPEVAVIQHGRFQLSANPEIGYEPVPNLEYKGALDSFHDYAGTSNSLGFRDRDHAVEKLPGVRRILILGDSVAAGQGVAQFEQTFPALLEANLNQGGLKSEVLSFAVTGYNTGQEVATLEEKGLVYRPDLVIVAYCLNDRRRSDGGVLETLVKRSHEQGNPRLSNLDRRLMASALYRLVRFRLFPPEPASMSQADSRAAAFTQLANLSHEHGFPVLIVLFPRFGKIEPYRYGAQHDEVAEFSHRHQFAHLDLLAALQDCRRREQAPLGLDRFHPTPLGHRCAARAVASYILSPPAQ